MFRENNSDEKLLGDKDKKELFEDWTSEKSFPDLDLQSNLETTKKSSSSRPTIAGAYKKQKQRDKAVRNAIIAGSMLSVPAFVHSYCMNLYLQRNVGTKGEPGFRVPYFLDFWLTIIAAACFTYVKSYFTCLPIKEKLKTVCKEQTNLFRREERSEKSLNYFWHALYHLAATVTGHIILKNSSFLPRWMGGYAGGKLANCFTQIPWGVPVVPYGREYLLITMAFMVHDLLELHFDKVSGSVSDVESSSTTKNQRPELLETTMHVFISLALCIMCYMSNLLPIALIVVFLLNIGGFFVTLARGFKETKWEVLYLTILGLTTPVWLYTRVFCLTAITQYIILKARFPAELHEYQPLIWFFSIALVEICLMNYFWSWLIIKNLVFSFQERRRMLKEKELKRIESEEKLKREQELERELQEKEEEEEREREQRLRLFQDSSLTTERVRRRTKQRLLARDSIVLPEHANELDDLEKAAIASKQRMKARLLARDSIVVNPPLTTQRTSMFDKAKDSNVTALRTSVFAKANDSDVTEETQTLRESVSGVPEMTDRSSDFSRVPVARPSNFIIKASSVIETSPSKSQLLGSSFVPQNAATFNSTANKTSRIRKPLFQVSPKASLKIKWTDLRASETIAPAEEEEKEEEEEVLTARRINEDDEFTRQE